MRVDERIEEHVRRAFSAVVGKDGDGMVAAIRDLGEEDAKTAVGYAVFVVGYIVNNAFPDGPNQADLRSMAEDVITGVADWVKVGTVDVVAAFLGSAATGATTFEGIAQEDLPGMAFVCGGYLLARYRLKKQRWFEYLDEIWNAAETAPEPSN